VDDFEARPEESIGSFVNKYPLTVTYFQSDERVGSELSMSLDKFRRKRDLSWSELERELQQHLARAVMPEKDCTTFCFTELVCGRQITALLFTGGILVAGCLAWILWT
jgi:hypothetical protein